MTNTTFKYLHAQYIVRVYKGDICVAIAHQPSLRHAYAFIARDSRLYSNCGYQIKPNI